jgi:hypothetical protein
MGGDEGNYVNAIGIDEARTPNPEGDARGREGPQRRHQPKRALRRALLGAAGLILGVSSCSPAPEPAHFPSEPAPSPASPPPAAAPSPSPPPAAAAQSADTRPAAPAPAGPITTAAAPKIREVTSYHASRQTPPNVRVQNAEATRRAVVEELFKTASVAFPPQELLFRAFKKERELEVWASGAKGASMTLIATYEICSISGNLGPKRREGDRQVPEGFYTIQYYWPISDYHLEMKIGYPNASDRVFGGSAPGGDIMLHGSCASIGCISMGDERIEELWVMATASSSPKSRVHVHIFPGRDMTALLNDPANAAHKAFWTNVKEGLDRFEQTRQLPTIAVDWRGRYSFQ